MLFPVGGKGGDEQRVVCQTLLPRHCLHLGDELWIWARDLGIDFSVVFDYIAKEGAAVHRPPSELPGWHCQQQ